MDALFEEAARLETEGKAFRTAGDLPAALERFTRMRERVQERVVRYPDDAKAPRFVALADRRIADACVSMGRFDEALSVAARALETCERLSDATPTDSELKRDVNLSCDLVGRVLMRMGRAGDATPVLRRGVYIARQLARDAGRSQSERRHDLAGSLEYLAWAFDDQGDLDGALKVQQEQVALARGLVHDSVGGHKFLASSLSSMGRVLIALERLREAKRVLDQAVTEYGRAFGNVPRQPFELDHLAVAHRRAGKAAARSGDFESAKRHLLVAVELGRSSIAGAPDVCTFQHSLQHALEGLAEVLRQLGETEGAAPYAREAADLSSRRGR